MKRPAVTILIPATLFCSLTLFHAGNVLAADKVVVIPLNSCKDSNLLPENIIWGVTICGVTGTSIPSGTVVSAGRLWMDCNLGASQVATSSADKLAYGDLYQWGRLTDGHEKRDSTTTTTLSPDKDNPGHGSFILAPNPPNDWRTPQNDSLWQGVSGTNNPCPSGFRLPTESEWQAEVNSWGIGNDNAAGAYNSPLKLVAAGFRYRGDGTINDVTTHGSYWSSTVDISLLIRNLAFSSTPPAGMSNSERADGMTVRCIKD